VYILLRVILKEFLQLRQDKKSMPMIILAPVVQLIIFGFAVNTDVTRVPMVLVDQDQTAASRDLVDHFLAGEHFELVGVEYDAGAIEPWLVDERAQVALIIATGYGEAMASGRAPQVQFVADGSDASSTTVALGYAAGVVGSISAERIRHQLESLLAEATSDGRDAQAVPGQIETVARVWYNPDLLSRLYFVPAVLVMILMTLTMILSAMGVVREKEIGTMEQISVTPIRPWQLLVGKLFPFAVIGMLQVFPVTAVAVWGFGVPMRGSFLLLLALTLLFLLNTLGMGLLVSTLVRTQQQAMMLTAFAVMVPWIYLSGLIFPIENMPEAIQYVTYGIPVRYYADIIRGIFLKGSGLAELWREALALAAMGLTLQMLAVLRFRKRLD
jgi:ABC-2 type transport system permease protein